MVYAADVWYMPVYLHAGRERRCSSVGITSRLASVQRLASTAIMGALHSTVTDILDLHTNLLPVELMLHKVCQRAAVQLAILPASHPLLVPFKTQAKHFIKTHRSPLHELAFIYDISSSSFKTLSPARVLPRCRNKFTTVPFSMEESIEWDRGNKADIHIYTDGSGLKGNAGTAAVLFQGSKAPKSLRYYLSSLNEHTTFEAEAVRLILGTHLLSAEPHISTVTVGTDSQAALLALNICKPGPGQQLIDKFLHATRHIQSRATLGDYALELAWVKGHADSIGNSQVDVEAREATTDNTNLAADLPSFLSGKPLPISSSAVKQKFAQELKAWWKHHWSCSPQFPKLAKIDPTMPSNKYQKLIAEYGRAQASLVTQIRTRYMPLNAYLHCINKINSPLCPHCGLDSESMHHFLFDCQAWRAECWCIGKALGCKAKSLQHVLSSARGIDELLRFLVRMEWFKAMYGPEITPV